MAASIDTKKSKIIGKIFKKTGGYLSDAVTDYISDIMPVSSSIIEGTKETASEISSLVKTSNQSITQKVKEIKTKSSFRNILNWYITNGGWDQDFDDFDNDLDFDIPTDSTGDSSVDSSEIAAAQIGETEKASNKISSSVISSSQHMLEGQAVLTAELKSTLDNQTAILTSGFEKINSNLTKILEVVTKNTSALITTNAALAASSNEEKKDYAGNMLGNWKFNLSDYKKMVVGNIKNSQGLSMLNTALSMKDLVSNPGIMISFAFENVMDKFFPKFKKNAATLDKALNDTIMDTLVRLGEDQYGFLGNLLGLRAERKEFGGHRSSLEVKPVPFDSIAHESITNTIPGYLRKILVQLGGDDMVYDYRSRSFRKSNSIKKEFYNVSSTRGSLGGATERVRKIFGDDEFGSALYDLMMTDLMEKHGQSSGTHSHSQAREILGSFNNPAAVDGYFKTLATDNGVKLTQKEIEALKIISKRLSTEDLAGRDVLTQVTKENFFRNNRMESYLAHADKYNINLSGLNTSNKKDIETILRSYGMIEDKGKNKSEISDTARLTGSDYTNKALYEIFLLLNRGINVYSVNRDKPYKTHNNRLKPPSNTIFRMVEEEQVERASVNDFFNGDKGDNLLRNNTDEEGNTEELTKGERFSRFVKGRGGQLGRALFTGDPEEVKQAFGAIVSDIGGVTKDAAKNALIKVNDSFGNVTGFIKHKFFGSPYSYKDENGNIVEVEGNDNGIFTKVSKSIMGGFNKAKEKAGNWFKTVAGYFDYGDSKTEGNAVVNKRKRFISASVGALGGGLLAGPLGLVMGAVAGNAIGQTTGIGQRIHDMLFGKGDEKGKGKGIFTKLQDVIIDPIRYQIGKTANAVGNVLKKHIFGPLSDIGWAIKERILSTTQTVFGKVFSFIGRMITGPFKLVGKGLSKLTGSLFKNVIAPLTGAAARGAAGATAGVAGFGLSRVANIIGAGHKRKVKVGEDENGNPIYEYQSINKGLKERRDERNADIKKDDKYSSFKKWKKMDDEEKAFAAAKESEKQTAEIRDLKEVEKKNQEDTSKIEQGVSKIVDEATTKGSLFTHDQGIHDKLDTIISIMKGETPDNTDKSSGEKKNTSKSGGNNRGNIENSPKSSVSDETNDNKDAIDNITQAASAVAASNGTDDEEDRSLIQIFGERMKKNPSVQKVSGLFKKILRKDESKTEEKEKKTNSLFDFLKGAVGGIFDFVKGNIPEILGIAGIIAAATGALGPIIDNIGGAIGTIVDWFKEVDIVNTLKNLASNIGKAIRSVIFGDEGGGSNLDQGTNAALALVDKHVDSAYDMANPMATMYHNQKTAGGEWIADDQSTNSKRWNQLGMPIVQTIQGNKWNNIKNTAKSNYYANKAAKYAGINTKKSEKFWNKSEKFKEQAQVVNSPTAAVATSIGKNALRVGAIGVAGGLIGSGVENIAKSAGVDEATAAQIGNVANRGSVGLMTADAILRGKKSIVNKVVNVLWMLLEKVLSLVKADKLLKAASKRIDDLFKVAKNKIKEKVTDKIAKAIMERITLVCGENVAASIASGATFGIPIAMGAIFGGINGAIGTEQLFGVMPDEADGLMTAISTAIKALFGALEWTPVVGVFVGVIDMIDDLVFKGIFRDEYGTGLSLKRLLAINAYKAIAGDEKAAELDQKRAALQTETNYYNEKYGASIDTDAFNDLVNTGDLLDKVWNGDIEYDEDGHIHFDEAGNRVSGGLSKIILNQGGERTYVKDSSGNVLKDAEGKAIEQVDAYGNTVFKQTDDFWENALNVNANNWNRFVRFFGGGDVYKTDANGNAIYDPKTGKFVVESHEAGVFDNIGEGLNDFAEGFDKGVRDIGDGIGAFFSDTAEGVGGFFSDTWDGITSTFSDIGDGVTSFFGDIGDTVGGITDWIGDKIGSIGNGITSFFGGIRDNATQFAANNSKIQELAFAGNTEELSNTDFEITGDAPLAGIFNGVLGFSKFIHTGIGTVIGFGNSIKDAFVGTISTIKNDNFRLDEATKKLDEKINSADIKGIWDSKFETSEGNIIGPFFQFRYNVSRVVGTIQSFFTWIGDRLSDFVDLPVIKNILELLGYDTSKMAKEKSEKTSESSSEAPSSAVGGPSINSGAFDNIQNKNNGSVEDLINDPLKINDPLNINNKNSSSKSIDDTLNDMKEVTGGRSYSDTTYSPFNTPYSVTSDYGNREDLFNDGNTNHTGVDVIPSDGSKNARIKSNVTGKVISVINNVKDSQTGRWRNEKNSGGTALNPTEYFKYGYFDSENIPDTGNMVAIQDANGYVAKFMHLKEGSIPANIKEGSMVTIGRELGTMGRTGRALGEHLHYEIANPYGVTINPKPFLLGKSKFSNAVPDSSMDTTSGAVKKTREEIIAEAMNDPNSDFWKHDNSSSGWNGPSEAKYEASESTYYANNSSTTEESSNEGLLAQILKKLQAFGAKLLYDVTGGLIDIGNSSSDSSISGGSANVDYSSDAAQRVVEVAKGELGHKENRGENINKYNDWFFGQGTANPWCMAFVQWCFNQAGVEIHRDGQCTALFNWYKSYQPEKVSNTPHVGDIYIRTRAEGGKGAGHTGIVSNVEANSFHTIEGNTGNDTVAERRHEMNEQSLLGFITPYEKTSAGSVSSLGSDDNVNIGTLWNYFKSKGWSDKAIAGALGCWTAESNGKAKRIEGDYLNSFKQMDDPYNTLINDRDAMNQYAINVLKKGGNKAYKGSDGNYYVGLGLAQWTGPRGEALLKFARDNNLPWDSTETQLMFMENELRTKYKGVYDAMESASDIDAATKVFMNQYEGNTDSTGYLPIRQKHANALAAQFGASAKGGPRVGGPKSKKAVPLIDPYSGKILEYQSEDDSNELRVGGPRYTSSFGNNIFKQRSPRVVNNNTGYTRRLSSRSDLFGANESIMHKSSPQVVKSIPKGGPAGTDLSGVISLMNKVVVELEKISSNTGSSNELLGSINDKDFVDKGLRDSFKSLKASKRSKNQISRSTAKTTAVTDMAKP